MISVNNRRIIEQWEKGRFNLIDPHFSTREKNKVGNSDFVSRFTSTKVSRGTVWPRHYKDLRLSFTDLYAFTKDRKPAAPRVIYHFAIPRFRETRT